MKQSVKTFFVPFFSVLLAVAPAVLFTVIVLPFYVGAILAGAGVSYLICAIAVNCVLMTKTKNRFMKTPMSVWETEIKKRREEIRANLDAETKKVNRLILRTVLYNISLCVAVMLVNCGGVILARAFIPLTDDFGAVEFCMVTAAACSLLFVIFYVPFTSPLFRPEAKKSEQFYQAPLGESAFPLLYALARKSAKAIDFRGAFMLYPNFDGAISVSDDAGVCSIYLSPETVSVLTEEELYCVLIHEFAHAKHKDTKQLSKYRNSVAAYAEPQHMKALFNAFFSHSAFVLEQKTELLLQYSSLLLETKADEEVKQFSLNQTFMNAATKLNLWDEVFREPVAEFAYGLYEGTTAPDDYYARKVEYYKAHARECYPRALEIMSRRLSAYNDSHPTFRMRAETFGVSEFDPFKEPVGEYAMEAYAFCAHCDKELRSAIAEEWRAMHEENYARPHEICERYEKNPEGATELLRLLALHAYSNFDFDKTLALADRLLAEDEGNNSAMFFKGLVLCTRDDEAGLPLLLESIRANYNQSDSFGLYGTTILRTGKQELLDRMREMQASFGQEMLDCAKKQYKIYSRLSNRLSPCPDDDRHKKIVQSVEAIAQNGLTELYLAQSENTDGVKRTVLYVPLPEFNSLREKLTDALQLYFSLLWRKGEEYYVFRIPAKFKLWDKVKATAQKIA